MRVLGSILTFLAVVTFLAPPPAFASTQSFVAPVSGSQPHPCVPGEQIAFNGNQHATIGVTVDKRGGNHLKAHINYQGVSGTGTSTTKYQLPTVSNFSNNLGSATTFTTTINLRVISNGAMPNFVGHQTFHFTINANGDPTASASNITFECNG